MNMREQLHSNINSKNEKQELKIWFHIPRIWRDDQVQIIKV